MHKRWGWFLTLLKGRQFKVKILYFKEGGSISKQRHKDREELWLFVFGRGKFERSGKGDDYGYWTAKAGDTFVVPKNHWHKYTAENPTLVLEIQTGKCSERDIVRA